MHANAAQVKPGSSRKLSIPASTSKGNAGQWELGVVGLVLLSFTETLISEKDAR